MTVSLLRYNRKKEMQSWKAAPEENHLEATMKDRQ